MRQVATPAAARGVLLRPFAALKIGGSRSVRRRPGGEAEEGLQQQAVPEEVSAKQVKERCWCRGVLGGVRLAPGAVESGDWIGAIKGGSYPQRAAFGIKAKQGEIEGVEQRIVGTPIQAEEKRRREKQEQEVCIDFTQGQETEEEKDVKESEAKGSGGPKGSRKGEAWKTGSSKKGLYLTTEVEPGGKSRNKLFKRDKRIFRAIRDSGASSTSSSSATTRGMERDNLVEDRSQLHRTTGRAPGGLSEAVDNCQWKKEVRQRLRIEYKTPRGVREEERRSGFPAEEKVRDQPDPEEFEQEKNSDAAVPGFRAKERRPLRKKTRERQIQKA